MKSLTFSLILLGCVVFSIQEEINCNRTLQEAFCLASNNGTQLEFAKEFIDFMDVWVSIIIASFLLTLITNKITDKPC